VTDAGNWEGVTILSRVRSAAELGEAFEVAPSEVDGRLASARERLLAQRSKRPQPARDDKALAAWNGLAIAALADAARMLGFAAAIAAPDGAARDDAAGAGAAGLDEPRAVLAAAAQRYRLAAERAAGAILDGLLEGGDGSGAPARLGRSWKDGRATGQGVLEDYANLAEGLLALYEATFDERWFIVARSLMDAVLERFADPDGGFFDTATDHERLITRPKDVQDNATPSGGAMAAFALVKLAALTGEGRYRTAAERAVAAITPFAGRYPTAFAMWLQAIDLALTDIAEVAVLGERDDPGTQALLRVAGGGYAPGRVVAASGAGSASAVPLLLDRPLVKGRPTAYVCRGFACQAPVTDADALQDQLAERAASL
jgi:uncharacterized protein YyaL (SSP411 family)